VSAHQRLRCDQPGVSRNARRCRRGARPTHHENPHLLLPDQPAQRLREHASHLAPEALKERTLRFARAA
jgi:hypothetical protein